MINDVSAAPNVAKTIFCAIQVRVKNKFTTAKTEFQYMSSERRGDTDSADSAEDGEGGKAGDCNDIPGDNLDNGDTAAANGEEGSNCSDTNSNNNTQEYSGLRPGLPDTTKHRQYTAIIHASLVFKTKSNNKFRLSS